MSVQKDSKGHTQDDVKGEQSVGDKRELFGVSFLRDNKRVLKILSLIKGLTHSMSQAK